MIDKVLRGASRSLKVVEIIIAVILAGATLYYSMHMLPAVWDIMQKTPSVDGLEQIISISFTLIIGVEFVKMICSPTTGTIVEVLMFAIARSLIFNHSAGVGGFFGVLSVAVLFAVKKYLFCDFAQENSEQGQKEKTPIYRIISEFQKPWQSEAKPEVDAAEQ